MRDGDDEDEIELSLWSPPRLLMMIIPVRNCLQWINDVVQVTVVVLMTNRKCCNSAMVGMVTARRGTLDTSSVYGVNRVMVQRVLDRW